MTQIDRGSEWRGRQQKIKKGNPQITQITQIDRGSEQAHARPAM